MFAAKSLFRGVSSLFLVAGFDLALSAAPSLTGETSHPSDSFFAWKSEAKLVLKASGFGPNETHPLSVRVLDHEEAESVGKIDVPKAFTTDAKGGWTGTFDLPTHRFGCFKVCASSGGVKLPKLGTRGEGCLTYAVVRDPDTRPLIPQEDAFFGCYGAPRWLGCRQSFAGYFSGTNAAWKAWGNIHMYHLLTAEDSRWSPFFKYYTAEGQDWIRRVRKTHKGSLLPLVLSTEEGERHYRDALRNVMRRAKADVPEGQKWRMYDPMSEVDLNIPKPEDAVKIARIVRETIDEVDPEGVISYPGVSTVTATGYQKQLFDLGLGQYLNGYSLHAYTPFPPEPNGFLRNVRALVAMVREHTRGDIPMFGTEAGYSSRNDKAGELMKLNGQLRTNLILMGEGFKFNYAFYGNDFGNDDNRCKDGDYGLRYNLQYGVPNFRYGPKLTSPRAIAAGIAAASWILDGKRPTSCLEGVFGETSLGYSFQEAKGEKCAIALWDFGGVGGEAKLPVGRDRIVVADVMGNEREVAAPGGVLTLKLSESPVYVIGPDAKMWGRGGTMAAKMAAEAKRLAAEREARVKLKVESVEPDFDGETPVVAVTVVNRTDAKQVVSVETRVKGVPEARQRVRAAFAPRETRLVRIPLAGFAPKVTEMMRLTAVASLEDGFCAEHEGDINFWKAERDLGESPKRHAVDPTGRIRFAFGWNDRGLVGDCEIDDEAHVNTREGWWSWNGDAIQMGFAKTWLEHPTENNWTDMLTQAPSEYTFALTPKGPQVCRTATFDYRVYPAGTDGAGLLKPEECPFTVTHRDGKTRYRYVFPWKLFNFAETPKAGTTVRIAAFVNDQDEPKGPVAYNKVFDLKQSPPKNFGRLVLGK